MLSILKNIAKNTFLGFKFDSIWDSTRFRNQSFFRSGTNLEHFYEWWKDFCTPYFSAKKIRPLYICWIFFRPLKVKEKSLLIILSNLLASKKFLNQILIFRPRKFVVNFFQTRSNFLETFHIPQNFLPLVDPLVVKKLFRPVLVVKKIFQTSFGCKKYFRPFGCKKWPVSFTWMSS